MAKTAGTIQIARAPRQPPRRSDVGTAIAADKLAEIAKRVTYTPVMSSIRFGNCSLTTVGIRTFPIAIARPINTVQTIRAVNPPIRRMAIAAVKASKTRSIARFSVKRFTRAGLAKAPRPKQTIGSDVNSPTWNKLRDSDLVSSSTNGPIAATGGLNTKEIKTSARNAKSEYFTAFIRFFPC